MVLMQQYCQYIPFLDIDNILFSRKLYGKSIEGYNSCHLEAGCNILRTFLAPVQAELSSLQNSALVIDNFPWIGLCIFPALSMPATFQSSQACLIQWLHHVSCIRW